MSLYIFSGKGGVGKTHLSTSLAYHLSSQKRRVLLVEFSYASLYTEFFSKEVGFQPVSFKEKFSLASWTGLDCLSEYVGGLTKSHRAADIFLKFPVVRHLIESAPGLREVAVLGKLTSDYREIKFKTHFDDIIFDGPASGHFLSLLKVPFGLNQTVGVGPMKNQCESIIECLHHSKDTKFIFVRDESTFSKNENAELVSSFKSLFPKKKEVYEVENFVKSEKDLTSSFSFQPSVNNWIESANSVSQQWESKVEIL